MGPINRSRLKRRPGTGWALLLALVLGASGGIASGQVPPEPETARPEAAYAFGKAWEAAATIPPQADRSVGFSLLLELASYLSVTDAEKASQALDHAASTLEVKWERTRPFSTTERRRDYYGLACSEIAKGYIELAGVAARYDKTRARKFLEQARQRNEYVDEVDQLFDEIIRCALLLLGGREKQAQRTALRYCTDQKTCVVSMDGTVVESRWVMAQALLWFDPRAAADFATQFDEPEFQAKVFARATDWIGLKGSPVDPELYEGLFAAAMALPGQGYEYRPEWGASKEQFLTRAAQGLAETDLDRAIRLINGLDAVERRRTLMRQCLPEIMSQDFEAAIKLAGPIGETLTTEQSDIIAAALTALAKRDPRRFLQLQDDPELKRLVRLFKGSTDPFEAVAEGLAREGEVVTGLQFLLLLGSAPTSAPRPVWLLRMKARNLAETDPAQALALLEEAFELALAYLADSGAVVGLVEDIEKLDPPASTTYLLRALQHFLAIDRQDSKFWSSFSRILERLAKEDPRRALDFLSQAPDVRFGDVSRDPGVVDASLLLHLAPADPTTVYGFFKEASLEVERWKSLAESIAQRLAPTHPDEAALFADLLLEQREEEKEGRRHYWASDAWPQLRVMIAGWKAYRALLSGKEDFEEIRYWYAKTPYAVSDRTVPEVLGRIFRTAVGRDPEKAVDAALAISDPALRNACLRSIAWGRWDDLSKLDVFLKEHIPEPRERFPIWMDLGRGRASRVAAWRVLKEFRLSL